jgi:hypothetical protein
MTLLTEAIGPIGAVSELVAADAGAPIDSATLITIATSACAARFLADADVIAIRDSRRRGSRSLSQR